MLRTLPITFRDTSATADRSRPSAAAPRGVEAVLDGDVVVHDHGLDRDAVLGSQLGGHLEVHDVAGVVEHEVQHTGPAVDGLRRRLHLVGHRGGEHLARAGRVQAAHAHVAALQWLVPRPAAGDDPDLALYGGVRPVDDFVFMVDPQ
jgi:hypothetical protein